MFQVLTSKLTSSWKFGLFEVLYLVKMKKLNHFHHPLCFPDHNDDDYHLDQPHETSSGKLKEISSMSVCVAVRQDSRSASRFVRHTRN